MTPKRRKQDIRHWWSISVPPIVGYIIFLFATLAGSSYVKEWITWQFSVNEQVKALQVDKARQEIERGKLIEKAAQERAATKKELEDQIAVEREDVRDLRRELHHTTKD